MGCKYFGNVEQDERHFHFIEFADARMNRCYLSESSAIDDSERGFNNPGSSFVRLGKEGQQMMLSREHVEELIKRMQTWLDTGSLNG